MRDQESRFLKSEYTKEWYKRNPQKLKEYYEKKKAKDPLHHVKKVYNERKRIAVKQGLPFNSTIDDIKEVPVLCPVLGIPLNTGGRNNPNSPSLDRLIPEDGYVKGNVAWISRRANRIKCDATPLELERVLEWVRGQIQPS